MFSNTVEAREKGDPGRIVKIDNGAALLANLTLSNGQLAGWDDFGTAFFIHANGGTVSNCVVEGCTAKGKTATAGYVYGPGLVTHTVFRDLSQPRSPDEPGSCNVAVAVFANNGGRIENCLFTDVRIENPYALVRLSGDATMRNCTIAKVVLGPSGATVTKQHEGGSISTNTPFASPLYVEGKNARIVNVVMVDVRDTNGAVLPALFRNAVAVTNGLDCCVLDAAPLLASETETTPAPEVPESCAVVAPGAVPELFRGWNRGEFTPEKDGALFNVGANWDGMPAVDLAGRRRLRGPAVDIGAFEWFPPEAGVMLLR